MPDVDSNGVDILDRFLAYKSKFMQFSVTEDVFHQVVEYIKELRKERDDARIELIAYDAIHGKLKIREAARARGWGYLIKEDRLGKE
jgi:hypothetical protein